MAAALRLALACASDFVAAETKASGLKPSHRDFSTGELFLWEATFAQLPEASTQRVARSIKLSPRVIPYPAGGPGGFAARVSCRLSTSTLGSFHGPVTR